MNRKPLLTASNLQFGFRQQRLLFENLSLEVEPGSLVSVLGPNGAGKSTLLSCLIGQRAPTKGSIYCAGKPLNEMNVRQIGQHIALVPQAHELTFALSVQQVVLLGRAAHVGWFTIPGESDNAVAVDTMTRVGIAHIAEKPFDQISGGEKQLTLIAMALAQQVPLIILDEPTSHLDIANQSRVLELIHSLVKTGHGVLMTTHYPEHALMLGGKALLILPSAEVRIGRAADIITEPMLETAYGAPVSLLRDKGVIACVPRFSWLEGTSTLVPSDSFERADP